MKTDQILAAVQKWAKENKYKIKAKIEKAPPAWVLSKDQSQGAGVTVRISNIDPIPCEVWLQESAGKVFISRKSKACEIYRIKKITEVGGGLTNAVGTHQLFAIFDIIEEWANANGYELGNQSIKEGYDDSYEYGRKDDPYVEEGDYFFKISFTEDGKLIIDRKISELWWDFVVAGEETKPDKIQKWLDENAKTGLYKDYHITHLDKKAARKTIRENAVNWGQEIYLYELESASDDAIEEFCKFKGTLHLSEKSFLALRDVQIEKLIKNTKPSNRNTLQTSMDLVIDIGIHLRGSVSEALCKKIAKHSISKHGNGRYIFNENIDIISDKCAAILAKCKSSEIDFFDLNSEFKVERLNPSKSS